MSSNNTSAQSYTVCHKVLGTAELLEQIQLSMPPTDAVHSRLVCRVFEQSFKESAALQTHCFYRQDSSSLPESTVVNNILLHLVETRGAWNFYVGNDGLGLPRYRLSRRSDVGYAELVFDEMPYDVDAFYGDMFFADRPVKVQILVRNPEFGMGVLPHWGSWQEARVTLLNPTLAQAIEAAEGLVEVARHWRDLLENHSNPPDSDDEADASDDHGMEMDIDEDHAGSDEDGSQDDEDDSNEEEDDGMDLDNEPDQEEYEDPRACICVLALGGNDCDQHWDWKDVFGRERARLCVDRPSVDNEDIWRKRYDPDLE